MSLELNNNLINQPGWQRDESEENLPFMQYCDFHDGQPFQYPTPQELEPTNVKVEKVVEKVEKTASTVPSTSVKSVQQNRESGARQFIRIFRSIVNQILPRKINI